MTTPTAEIIPFPKKTSARRNLREQLEESNRILAIALEVMPSQVYASFRNRLLDSSSEARRSSSRAITS